MVRALSWQAQSRASDPGKPQGAVKAGGWETWDVSAAPCHERRSGSSEEQPVSHGNYHGGMQQIHCFVEDCLQPHGFICCLSVVISSFLKCFW